VRISSFLSIAMLAVVAALFVDVLPFSRHSALAANFSSITGSWAGQGALKLGNGKTERLRCRAYYNPKKNGQQLGMAVRCASTSYKFEFRSKLSLNGTKVSGSWEEREFNAVGTIAGTFKEGKISLRASGGVDALLSVTYTSTKQSVNLKGDFGDFKGISLSFRK